MFDTGARPALVATAALGRRSGSCSVELGVAEQRVVSTGGDHVREGGARERRRRTPVDLDQAVDAFGRDLDERAIPLKPASLTSTASSDSLWIDEGAASIPPSSDRSRRGGGPEARRAPA